MDEADEVAESIAKQSGRAEYETMTKARELARRCMGDEAEQVIDNVAEALVKIHRG